MQTKRALISVLIYCTIMALIILFFYTSAYIKTTTDPIVKPVIIVDPGHGIPDGGALAKDGTKESELNLKIANELRKTAIKKGATVIMTRTGRNSLSNSKTNNKKDDMNKRRKIRDTCKADLFISIHMNHYSDPKYFGAQVFYNGINPANKVLAENIQKSLISVANPENTRTIKEDNSIYILKGSPVPSVLVECGFLSNDNESEMLKSEKYQKTIAKAIYRGIEDYFNKNQEY